jgi:hypothetical protein
VGAWARGCWSANGTLPLTSLATPDYFLNMLSTYVPLVFTVVGNKLLKSFQSSTRIARPLCLLNGTHTKQWIE